MLDINEILKYSKRLNLLYVEDNEDAREMTTMILEEFFDNIIVAVDGEDGYEKFKNNTVDLIITDINMPKMDGLEMSKKIREIDSDVSIIILSAHNEDDFFMKSIDIGVNGYLLKPINIDQFTNQINMVMQRHKYKHQSESNLNLLKSYQEAVNQSSIVSKTNTKGIITYVNDAFCDITGYTREELIGHNHNIVRHPDNPKSMFEDIWTTIRDKKSIWKGIVRNRTKNGSSYYVDSIVMPIIDLDGKIIEYISLRNDITAIMNPLKQLKNELKDADNPLLIYIKLNDFSEIEEFNKFRQNYSFDKLYKLEDGEYALVIDSNIYEDDKKKFLDNLTAYQEIIREEKIDLGEVEYDISILISIANEKEEILESVKIGIKKLLKEKKTFIIANNFASMEHDKAKENMKTVFMIKNAIYNSKIISHFQPIIDNKTQKIVKYESLVRLVNEEDKVLAPYFFLETAKKSNYYLDITNIVLENSFNILKHCNFDISINLSALDIEQTSMRQKILGLLETHKEFTSRVVFELLEDESINNFSVVKEFILTVKNYGVKIAIDDFGAGYSNYERLLDYQPDILKIDGCLIRDIETSSYSYSVVKSIVTFAKEQNLQTVAEFIENEAIFKIVKELGVDFSQGYYFGKPEPLNVS